MKIKVIAGFNARKILKDGITEGFAPLAPGEYEATIQAVGRIEIAKPNGDVVYFSAETLEQKMAAKEAIILQA